MNLTACNPHGFANCPLCEPDPPKEPQGKKLEVSCARCGSPLSTSGPKCGSCLDRSNVAACFDSVRDAERERCAKVCESIGVEDGDYYVVAAMRAAAQKIREGR